MNYLYKDFLKDQRAYNLNEAFYRQLIKGITGELPKPFFQPSFANGKKIYDDHIFSTKYKGRILQIIQKDPISEKAILRARQQKWDGEYDMLVLTLELSKEVKPLLEEVIRKWLVDKVPFKEIQAVLAEASVNKYQDTTAASIANDDGS